MTSNRIRKTSSITLGAVLALAAAAGFAADTAQTAPQPAAPVTIAQADPVVVRGVSGSVVATETIRPMETRVRQAAREGPTALRRYIMRTEPIYHRSYWDYAKYLPPE